MPDKQSVKMQAISLAKSNKEVEPNITEIHWFPDETEIRLVEVQTDIPKSSSPYLEPFYFGAAPSEGLFLKSAIALVHPDDKKELKLPKSWVGWEQAEKIL